MRKTCLALSLAAALPAQAGQPIHESLVECSVLIDLLLGEQSTLKGQHEMIDLYIEASESLRDEAVRRKGWDYVDAMSDTKRKTWHVRWDEGDWDNPENRGDLIDWWNYCFKLGDHLGL